MNEDMQWADESALCLIAETEDCPYCGTEFSIKDDMVICLKCGWMDGPVNHRPKTR